MKILITGSTGFLGRRAADHFTALGYEVLTPSRSRMDITDAAAVDSWFRVNRPQAVLHCAAVSDTGLCQKEPDRSHRINVDGSIHLAQSCCDIGAKFLLCSSDQVYAGASLPGPHTEGESLTPGSVYAQQKLMAEQQCQALCPNTVCLRLTWMYDTRSFPGEHGHLMTTLCAALNDPSLPLSWPVHDRRGITDVNSVAMQLPAALSLPAGVYNFGSENDMDTFHSLQAVFHELDLQAALDRLTPNVLAFADLPRDIRMNCSLAASYGITFPSTRAGLCNALKKIL